MKALLAIAAALGVAALVVVGLRRQTPTPPLPAGSWEPADTSTG